jgi:hypothetical protein
MRAIFVKKIKTFCLLYELTASKRSLKYSSFYEIEFYEMDSMKRSFYEKKKKKKFYEMAFYDLTWRPFVYVKWVRHDKNIYKIHLGVI